MVLGTLVTILKSIGWCPLPCLAATFSSELWRRACTIRVARHWRSTPTAPVRCCIATHCIVLDLLAMSLARGHGGARGPAEASGCGTATLFLTHTCIAPGCLVAGYNANGQLGDNTTTTRNMSTAVVGSIAFEQLTVGFFHTCGLQNSTGVAFCWGGLR